MDTTNSLFSRNSLESVSITIPIYVLNIQGDRERYSSITRQLNSLNLAYTICPALTPESLTKKQIQESRSVIALFRTGRFISAPELACALSHRNILELFLKTGHSHALILEDDAIIDTSILPYLQPTLWQEEDEIILGSIMQNKPSKQANGRVLPDGNMLLESGYLTNGTFARILSRRYAIERLGEWNPVVVPVDNYRLSYKRFSSYILSRLVVQHPPMSPEQSRIKGHPLYKLNLVSTWRDKNNPRWKQVTWFAWRTAQRLLITIENTFGDIGLSIIRGLARYV